MAYGGQFGGDYPQNSCEEDHDGEVEDYCVTILEEDPITPGIDEVDGNFGMLVYPTPMANNITIKLEIFGGNTTLEVLDMTGRTVLSHQMTSIQTSVDVAKLSSGTYVLHATNISGEILGRFRIVKN
jgi:hypothetical protein